MSVSILCNWGEAKPKAKIDRRSYAKAYRAANKEKIKARRRSEIFKEKRRATYKKATLDEINARKAKRAAYRAANKEKISQQRKSQKLNKEKSFKFTLNLRLKSLLNAYKSVLVKEKKIIKKKKAEQKKEIRRVNSIIRKAEYQKRFKSEWSKRNRVKNREYKRKNKLKKQSEKIVRNFFQINAAIAALKNAGN
jgi:hypothetical protein